MRGKLLVPLLLAALVSGCAVPPPDKLVADGLGASKPTTQLAIGKNAVGEECTQAQNGADARSADVYCGEWQQPSARVHAGGAASAADLPQLATSGAWRTNLDARFNCEAPAASSILGGQPAQIMVCTRRVGGWAHVALVASVNGTAWYADGVRPAVQAMERSIGILAGVMKADAAPVSSAADTLLASRLAAQSFSSGDVGQYDKLIAVGTRANLANNQASAEAAFRAALALQQKALGRDNPETATVLMSLGLQVSNGGRFAEADSLFGEASRLVGRSSDPTAAARLAHYRGIHLLNQAKPEDALAALTLARAMYGKEMPAEARNAKAVPTAVSNPFIHTVAGRLGDLIPTEDLLTNPAAQSALLGLIEVERNRGVALRLLHRSAEAEEALRTASDLARGNGLARPIVTARLYRSASFSAAALGQDKDALDWLTQSSDAFDRSLPGSKPHAETNLLYAGQLVRAGQFSDALPVCKAAVLSLTTLKTGTTPGLMGPCLQVYMNAAERGGDGRQALLAEMFIAAQLGQGGITSQQIAQASATLAENKRDPKVADAIRLQRDLKSQLDGLYGKRDDLAQLRRQGNAPAGTEERAAELDKQITELQTKASEADAALQAASPNYGQLVQEVVKVKDVYDVLHPGEAFVAMTLTDSDGWVFALRADRITVSHIAKGSREIGALVRRIRAGIELTTDALPIFDIEAARAVYDLTLAGVAPALDGAKSVVVAPTGSLLSLPFEVMLTGPATLDGLAKAPWLVRQFTLAHVPAPSNFVSLRKIAGGSRATRPWFGFGEFHPVTLAQARKSFPGASCADSAQLIAGLPPLPYATRELAAARGLLGAAANEQLVGYGFTAEQVLKTPLKDYRILQFSTHALLPTELRCQSEAAIVTSTPLTAADAKGALLTASQVVSLQLDADLVILSACNSGGPGGATAGESLSGLARAFFYAGARSLLVTHWSVNDQVTAFLVADTLRRLRGTPAIGIIGALRDAQLGMLDGAGKDFPPELAHPFFWAPFTVIGEGNERVAPAASAGLGQKVAGL